MENETKGKVVRVGPLGTFFVILILIGLIGVVVYQSQTIADLRVRVEEVKTSTFLATQQMVVDKYWSEQKSQWACIVGDELMQTNQTLLKTMEGLGR